MRGFRRWRETTPSTTAAVDGDGQVSYLEVSAFVDRANQSIPNEEYRPNVYARSPKNSPVLLDLRGRRQARIEVPGTHAGRYLLEDSRGVRIADFHNANGQATYLLRPSHIGRLYLRRAADDVEFVIPGGPDVVELAALAPSEPREHARGAANDAFELLFALPFGQQVVSRFALPLAPVESTSPARGPMPAWRPVGGSGLLAAAVATGIVGAWTLKSAHDAASSVGDGASGADVAVTNDAIRARNIQAGIELGCAGAAAISGALLLAWPHASPQIDVNASASATTVSWHTHF